MGADPNKIKEVKTLKLPGDVLSVTHVPGTNRIFVGGTDANVYAIDTSQENPEPTAWQGHKSYISSLAYVSGDSLVSGGWDKQLIWWDIASGKPVRTIQAHKKWVRKIAVTPDGHTIASVGDDMVCRTWNTQTGELVRELRGHEPITPHHFLSKLYTCVISPDGQHLATADRVGHIVVWEIATGAKVAELDAPLFYHWDFDRNNHSAGGIRSLAFSADGKLLAAGGIENTDVAIILGNALVQVFDWKSGERTHEFKQGSFVFENLAFHHQDDWLLGAAGGGGSDRKLLFYNLQSNSMFKELIAPTPIYGMALSETSETIYGGGREKVVQWDLKV